MSGPVLYFYADKSGGGSSLAALGLMRILKRRFAKVAFFRPIVPEGQEHDCRLLRDYFRLALDVFECRGFGTKEARHFIAVYGENLFFERLIERYETLLRSYDFVLCQGICSDLFSRVVDNDINIEIARHFSAPVVTLIDGYQKSFEEIVDTARLQQEALREASLTHIATIVNRVDEDYIVPLRADKTLTNLFAVPYVPALARPSVADMAEETDFKMLRPVASHYLSRASGKVRIAAQRAEKVLRTLEEGDTLLCPADRSDIVFALYAALDSGLYPSVSAVVLTDGEKADETVEMMLQTEVFRTIPLFVSDDDTLKSAEKIAAVRPKIRSGDSNKIALALGVFAEYVDEESLREAYAASHTEIVTPQMFRHRLFALASRKRMRIVLPEAQEERILYAAQQILNAGIADILFVSDPISLRKRAARLGLDLHDARCIDPSDRRLLKRFAKHFYRLRRHKGITYEQAIDTVRRPNYFATMCVYTGDADGMVSGATHSTAETIRPALQILKTVPGVKKVSSIFFISLQTRTVVFGDCAVIPDPTSEELAEIAILAAENAARFGIEPKVAMISYSTGDSGSGEAVEKVRRATESVRARRPDLAVDGPLQFDAAFDPEVARIKCPHSPVAGRASVFIFPDLNTGNTVYKAVQRSSDAVAIGPVLQGVAKPVNDLSRGATIDDIVDTIAVTAVEAQGVSV